MLIPPHPEAAPIREPLVLRLRHGLRSWLALLTPFSYRLPVGVETILGQRLLLVNEPQAVRRVLLEEVEHFPKHPFTFWVLEPLIGRGVFSVNGEEWRRQRRLIDQALQQARLTRVFPQMQAACADLIARLEPQADGRDVDMQTTMTLVTADVIVRTLTSEPLAAAEAEQVFLAFSRYQRRAAITLILRLLRLPRLLLQGYLARHARPIRAWLHRRIDARLAAAAPSQDLLQALVDSGAFSREQLVDQVCTLFLAGHETSAAALAMAAWLLSQSPAVQGRLQRELQALLAGSDRPLQPDDLRQLPYTLAVFQETLRLYPPLIFFTRESSRDTELAGQRCPLRALVSISPWVIHRHHNLWPDPDGFDPERFLAAGAAGPAWPPMAERPREAYLPFGLGPRHCPGAAFAQQEALLVLAELVRHFELLPAGGPAPDLVGRLTLRSRNGIAVKLRRRSCSPATA